MERNDLNIKFINFGGIRDISDDNIDVEVTLPSGKIYSLSFFTFKNLQTIKNNWGQSGECLSGRYFCANNPIFVEQLTKENIIEIIYDIHGDGKYDRFAICFIPLKGDFST